ncbi:glutathione s-transferase u8 [Quercus suber]|uniref:Glutathione s-transferase u8 n=1 Tax=Quercus suber TaxID=58331 RepID=A0AAW0L0K9_QUESU
MSRCYIQSSGRLAQSHLVANFLSKKYKNFQDATSENSKCILSAWAACRAQEHEKENAVEPAQESLGIIDKLIEGKKFFGGETIGFLDLVVGSLPNWLKFLEELGGIKLVDEEKFPSFHEWSKKFVEIPIIKEKIPMPEDLIKYFTTSGLAKTILGSALANNKYDNIIKKCIRHLQ